MKDEILTKQWYFYKGTPTSGMSEDFCLISGTGNAALTEQVAKFMGIDLSPNSKLGVYSDGELSIQLTQNIRGKNVYIIESVCNPVNDNLAELLLLIATAHRSSAESVTAVVPYYAYSRMAQRLDRRVPIAAADVAVMLTEMGADRIISVDLHHGQLQGYFPPNVPVDNLSAVPVGALYFAEMDLQRFMVVAADAEMVPKSKIFLDTLLTHGHPNAELAIIVDDKQQQRDKGGHYIISSDWKGSEMEIVGDVSGKNCIIVKDIIDSAWSVTKSAEELKKRGAKRVYAFSTHGLFTSDACERVKSSCLDGIVVTNTVPISAEALETGKIKVISLAPLLAESIRRVHDENIVADNLFGKA